LPSHPAAADCNFESSRTQFEAASNSDVHMILKLAQEIGSSTSELINSIALELIEKSFFYSTY
jgi:hypothetical protein